MKNNLVIPENFPIPRKRSVILKQITQGTLTTSSGIELLETSESTQRPNVGRIYAVGPDNPGDLKPGLKVYYNQYANLEIIIEGHSYFLMHDEDIHCILTEETYVKPSAISSKEIRRGKKQSEHDSRVKLSTKISENTKDKNTEKRKKK